MKKKLQEVCFHVDNYDEVYNENPKALENLKSELARLGVAPVFIDCLNEIFCVEITYPELSTQEILNLFAKFGYRAEIREGLKKEHSWQERLSGKKIFEIRFKPKNEICFEVDNYDEVYEKDPEALEKLEREMSRAGASPTRVDSPSRTFCVEITYPELSTQEILNLFAKFGYRAQKRGVK